MLRKSIFPLGKYRAKLSHGRQDSKKLLAKVIVETKVEIITEKA